MKNLLLCLLTASLLGGFSAFASPTSPSLKGFSFGNPAIQSIHALAFHPDGTLFIGDSKAATVFAIETSDQASRSAAEELEMRQLDQVIANLLGVEATEVSIQDMAVHPLSKAVYLAVNLPDGKPVLMRLNGKSFEIVSLDAVNFAKTELESAVEVDAKDGRGRSLRKWAISDLAFFDNQVMVSGLSNEEFSSTFRMIPFPFSQEQMHASLEIYHAAHGRYETYAPIKAFLPYELDGQAHLIASYTCTPLVIFPLKEFTPGKHHKAKTVAELGNRNTPLDIISYKKGDESFLLMANSSRALMKIDPTNVSAYSDYLTEPVEENSATAGIDFINLPYVNVQQLDDYNADFVVMIQRQSNGSLDLMTVSKKRL